MDESRSPQRDDDRRADRRDAGPKEDERGRGARASREPDADLQSHVDEASESSFPASDPPAWMGMPPGGPPPRRP